jgi:hypothetical protein
VIWVEQLHTLLDEVLFNTDGPYAVDYDSQEFQMDSGVEADFIFLRYHIKDQSFSWFTFLTGDEAEVDTTTFTIPELKALIADPVDLEEWEEEA